MADFVRPQARVLPGIAVFRQGAEDFVEAFGRGGAGVDSVPQLSGGHAVATSASTVILTNT
jgi:hypothetical protein